ncbi:hypothetical protein E4U55_000498 [Claviceps digitariae]|nr:hypothetical protein E4U55_000498 [Claviceps digitariae]
MAHHYNKATPADARDVDLTIANLVLHASLFPLACYIAWKHGRRGILCWPTFVLIFVLVFISAGWKISHRDNEKQYVAASIYTDGGILGSFILSVIGLIHEIGVVIPQIASSRTKKAILVSSHFFMLITVGIAFYGQKAGADAPDEMAPLIASKVSYCLFLVILSGLVAWLVWTGRRMSAYKDHVQFCNAKAMLFAAAIGLSILGFRLLHAIIFVFTRAPSLDANTGSLATKLVLVFFLELAGTITLCVGGWYSGGVGNPLQTCDPAEPSSESKVAVSENTTELGVKTHGSSL